VCEGSATLDGFVQEFRPAAAAATGAELQKEADIKHCGPHVAEEGRGAFRSRLISWQGHVRSGDAC
jgi:hypothetical protein